MSAADSTAGVLELRGLDVGYYKDLNILQDLNVKGGRNRSPRFLGQTELVNPRPSRLHLDF